MDGFLIIIFDYVLRKIIIQMRYKPSRIRKIYPIESPCKKTMYNSFIDAKESLDYLLENKGVKDLSAYKCSMCGFWHLTSKSKGYLS
jgi:hypothetical protein